MSAKYVAYMSVADEMYESEALRGPLEDMLRQRAVDDGLSPVLADAMTITWTREWPRLVDPYEFLTRWERLPILLRLRRRPEPYEVRDYALRGVIRVAEDAPFAHVCTRVRRVPENTAKIITMRRVTSNIGTHSETGPPFEHSAGHSNMQDAIRTRPRNTTASVIRTPVQ